MTPSPSLPQEADSDVRRSGHGHTAWRAFFAVASSGRRGRRPTAECGPEAKAIATRVAETHGFTFARLLADDRHRPVVIARYAAFRAIDGMGIYSYAAIGRMFGMNHTGVLHGLGRTKRSRVLRKGRAP